MADIDKGLYEAPKGMEELGEQETAIEIEIEDPEEVNIKIGDMEINIDPCLLYTSPSPRDRTRSRMPSSA